MDFLKFNENTVFTDELYDEIIEKFKEENPDWDIYFSDSVYFELGDWFAHKCGVKWDDELGYPDFVDDFKNYAWDVLFEEYCN